MEDSDDFWIDSEIGYMGWGSHISSLVDDLEFSSFTLQDLLDAFSNPMISVSNARLLSLSNFILLGLFISWMWFDEIWPNWLGNGTSWYCDILSSVRIKFEGGRKWDASFSSPSEDTTIVKDTYFGT